MKRFTFFLTLLSVLAIFLYAGCCIHDDDDDGPWYCSEEGVITGIDYRECACCGGWFIEIDGEEVRAPTLPQDFTETLDPNEFPLSVFLEWENDPEPCLGDEIIVECIRRQ